MHNLLQRVCLLLADESGQDLIEYALLAAFIGLGVVAAARTLASAIGTVFANVSSTLTGSL